MKGHHLLLVALGPVQDFIASARRCQDLWYGSHLLSELSRAVAERIGQLAGRRALIFPSAFGQADEDEQDRGPEERQAVANKILALLPKDCRPEEVAAEGCAHMRERLEALMKGAFARLPPKYWDRPMAEAQVRQLMEYQWVAVPLEEEEAYARAWARAEELLSWRKNTRLWEQPQWPQPPGRPKSALDGNRESVLHEELFDQVRAQRMTAEALRKQYHVRPSERLCGVGLLKRLGEDEDEQSGHPPFHSAAHIASGPLRTRMHIRCQRHPQARAFLQEYIEEVLGERLGVQLDRFQIRCGRRSTAEVRNPLRSGGTPHRLERTLLQKGGKGHDGILLFAEQLPNILEGYSRGGCTEERLRQARQALNKLLREVGLSRPPCPAYALLLADGDRMGAAIDQLAKQGGERKHRELSRALHHFAQGERREGRSCLRILEQQGGSPVYVGGDDVMALLPLHTALACARALRDFFAEKMEPVFAGTGVEQPTLSVGLGIGHYQESLGEVRRRAREAEQLAKQRRDSLAIVAAKRSGGTLRAVARWDEGLVERIYGWCRRYAQHDLPEGVAYDLEQVLAPLLVDGAGSRAAPEDEVVDALVRYVLERKRRQGGAALIEGRVRDEVAEALARHRQIQDGLAGSRAGQAAAVVALAEELQLARLFLMAYEDAWEEL